MENADIGQLLKCPDVLKQLGDREPATEIEAQAVLDCIRARNGYLDTDVINDINSMQRKSRDCVLGLLERYQSKTAAYTKRYIRNYSRRFHHMLIIIQHSRATLFIKIPLLI
jgi:hypothetical protein